jgi:glucokinase
VGIAGLIDRAGGTLVFSPNLGGWDGLEVASSLRARTGASVVVDNDCNAFAFGAVESGLMPRTGLQVFITIGTGIGGTIVVDGSILYGTGFAGEFGHMAVEASGMPCPCGSTGCWERYAGRAALIRYYLDGDPAGMSVEPDPREIAGLAGKGDRKALEAFDTFGTWIGRGLANLANCLSPEGFFVAGGLTNALPLYAASAEAEYRSRCRHPWNLSVIPGSTEAGARGAALMARKSVR